MRQKEAMAVLGVSERALRRYAQKGALTVSYQADPRGGKNVIYDAAQVQALKKQLANGVQVQAKNGNGNGHALARPDPMAKFSELLERVVTLALRPAELAAAPDPPLTLSLDEASQLTGLSVWYLQRGRATGKLRAIRDRVDGVTVWRTRREWVEEFVSGGE